MNAVVWHAGAAPPKTAFGDCWLATAPAEVHGPRHSPATVHTLHPGDLAVAEQGDRLETLLGSCIAVLLTDPRRTTGAMCHFVHSSPAPNSCRDTAAYAATAMRNMYALLRARGIEPKMCEAFVYGGGNMFPDIHSKSHIGDENARWALDTLARDGVKVLFHDVGGQAYRRVGWTIGSGMPDVVAVSV